MRDFTDDVYNSKVITKNNFIEKLGSNDFTNLLVVIAKTKHAQFLLE